MLNHDFYRRRADQEHELGIAASTPAAAAVHRQLEAAYRAKLDDSTAVPEHNGLVIAAGDALRASGLWSNQEA